MAKFSEKLKTLRLKAGLTQKQLGDILHVTAQAVSNWERGETLPDSSLFLSLAKALNTSVSELLGETIDESVIISSDNFESDDFKNEPLSEKSAYSTVIEQKADDKERQSIVNVDAKSRQILAGKKKVLIIVSILLLVVIVSSSLLIYNIYKVDLLKTKITVASDIFQEEDNISVNIVYNGEVYKFARKHFFDGRAIMYYQNGETLNYHYKDTLYNHTQGTIKTTSIGHEAYLKSLPPIYSFEIKREQIYKVKSSGNFVRFKLKTLDNLPIAQYFGFTENAEFAVLLNKQKLYDLVIEEGDNKFEAMYLFGYGFQFSIPDYINP